MWDLFFVAFTCLLGSVVGQCQSNWVQYGNSCYHFSHDIENWPDAMVICRAVNAYLVEIDDENENTFIITNMTATNGWIGLSDLAEEGKWKWMNSQMDPVYLNWATGEPNNGDSGNENCGMIRKSEDGWNDYVCQNGLHYICEKKIDEVAVVG